MDLSAAAAKLYFDFSNQTDMHIIVNEFMKRFGRLSKAVAEIWVKMSRSVEAYFMLIQNVP